MRDLADLERLIAIEIEDPDQRKALQEAIKPLYEVAAETEAQEAVRALVQALGWQ